MLMLLFLSGAILFAPSSAPVSAAVTLLLTFNKPSATVTSSTCCEHSASSMMHSVAKPGLRHLTVRRPLQRVHTSSPQLFNNDSAAAHSLHTVGVRNAPHS